MSPVRILLIAISLVFIAVIARLVKRKHLSMKYSFLWIALLLVVLLCAMLPVIPYRMSDLLGFESPANFIFLVAIFFLLAISLSLSIVVSKLQRKITTLVQELALLDNRVNKRFEDVNIRSSESRMES